MSKKCVFVTFPYGALGQAWYLIVSILDLCLPFYIFIWLSLNRKRASVTLSGIPCELLSKVHTNRRPIQRLEIDKILKLME